ncbi:MAG: Na/Pi cotransporter family protein [Symploca sp. SIO2G7]|nr:Na/Pi cotransporter family protein [Symploca sp. SIO2G7]
MVTPPSQHNSTSAVDTDAHHTTDPITPESRSVSSQQSKAKTAEFPSLGQSWLHAGGAVFALYGLFASIDLLAIGFQSMVGPQAEALLGLAANPWLGLLLGILATALMQSSSIVTTLLVGLVAGGLSIATAIPMVMGANLGTTITNTLVSLGYLGNDEEFERGFAAATIHDCFNLTALVIFFPLELLLHPLEKLSQWLLTHSLPLAFLPSPLISPIGWLVKPTRWIIAYGVNSLHGPWDLLLLFGASIAGLMVSVTVLSWSMKQWLTGPVKLAIYWITGHGSGLAGIATGTGITALLQSSSMITSLMVPLASADVVTLEEIYPFVLGANIGTCITAVLATLAVNSPVALQLALAHVSYNLLAVLLVYGLPPLKIVPLTMAKTLAAITKQYRLVAVAYVVGIFFLLPFSAMWLSLMVIT